MPSAVQNRPAANGRSPETTSTTVLGSDPAFSLNTLVDFAHTAVSRLGTMLSTLRLPAKSLSPMSFRSLAVRLNSGTVSPFCGNLPATLIGLPPSVMLAMRELLGIERRSIPPRAQARKPPREPSAAGRQSLRVGGGV